MSVPIRNGGVTTKSQSEIKRLHLHRHTTTIRPQINVSFKDREGTDQRSFVLRRLHRNGPITLLHRHLKACTRIRCVSPSLHVAVSSQLRYSDDVASLTVLSELLTSSAERTDRCIGMIEGKETINFLGSGGSW